MGSRTIVELEEVAVGGTGCKTRATRDTTAGKLHQERRIGRLANANGGSLANVGTVSCQWAQRCKINFDQASPKAAPFGEKT